MAMGAILRSLGMSNSIAFLVVVVSVILVWLAFEAHFRITMPKDDVPHPKVGSPVHLQVLAKHMAENIADQTQRGLNGRTLPPEELLDDYIRGYLFGYIHRFAKNGPQETEYSTTDRMIALFSGIFGDAGNTIAAECVEASRIAREEPLPDFIRGRQDGYIDVEEMAQGKTAKRLELYILHKSGWPA